MYKLPGPSDYSNHKVFLILSQYLSVGFTLNAEKKIISIVCRTIINGICYLATFVFGINSVGLFLYSGQLALNSLMGESTSEETTKRTEESSNLTESDSLEMNKSSGDNNIDGTQ